MKSEAKTYFKIITNYTHKIITRHDSEYKYEQIQFIDEKKREWNFYNKYSKKENNNLIETTWKCIHDTFEKKGIIKKSYKYYKK
jgi:uncharacterized protein YabN with tetrapyrrole methylase and pyrophosphatase domain